MNRRGAFKFIMKYKLTLKAFPLVSRPWSRLSLLLPLYSIPSIYIDLFIIHAVSLSIPREVAAGRE